MDDGQRNQRLAISALGSVLVVFAALGAMRWLDAPRWHDLSPSTVLILSDTEIATSDAVFCREQRAVVTSSTSSTLRVRVEHLVDPNATKFCAIGDCGWAPISPPEIDDLDPELCRVRMDIGERVGNRDLIVECPNSCVSTVRDARPNDS